MLYGRRFPLRLKGAVYRNYVGTAMLYESETWCLKESEIRNLQRLERSIVRVIGGVLLTDRKKSKDLILVLGLNETVGHLFTANSV